MAHGMGQLSPSSCCDLHPEVTVEVGNEQFEATTRILRGAEREKAFEKTVEVFPPYGSYQKKTSREIPVILSD
jgi:F420H(2)-dependent quinone reductase